MNKAGEDEINRGSYPFVYFDPNDLNWQKSLHIYCKRTIKTFHSKIEQLFHYEIIYTMRFEGTFTDNFLARKLGKNSVFDAVCYFLNI